MTLKIAVYMITKNEDELLARALQSTAGADLVIVGDTGGSYTTEETVLGANAEYASITISPWRFDDARNAVLALIPSDVDVCVPLDSDEVLAPGWREEIEKTWKPDSTIMRYMYDWSKGVTFQQAKIHARNGYRWTRPCHEIITRYADGPDVYCTTDKFLMYHHPDDTKGRAYYLPLLRMGYKEAPRDDRSVFYYGRELYLRSNYQGITEELRAACKREGTKVLKEALELIKDAPNRAEASYAWRMIGQMNEDGAAFKKSIEEAPYLRDGYIFYADYLYYEKEFEKALKNVDLALSITQRTSDYCVDPKCWDGYPYHLQSWCFYHLKKLTEAIAAQERATKLEPNNEYYKKCLEKFENELRSAEETEQSVVEVEAETNT